MFLATFFLPSVVNAVSPPGCAEVCGNCRCRSRNAGWPRLYLIPHLVFQRRVCSRCGSVQRCVPARTPYLCSGGSAPRHGRSRGSGSGTLSAAAGSSPRCAGTCPGGGAGGGPARQAVAPPRRAAQGRRAGVSVFSATVRRCSPALSGSSRWPLRSPSPVAVTMYLCRAASQALASRLSRAPSAASRLKQRGTRGPPRSSTGGRVARGQRDSGDRTRGAGWDGTRRDGEGWCAAAAPPAAGTAREGRRQGTCGAAVNAAGYSVRLRLPAVLGAGGREGVAVRCLVIPTGNRLASCLGTCSAFRRGAPALAGRDRAPRGGSPSGEAAAAGPYPTPAPCCIVASSVASRCSPPPAARRLLLSSLPPLNIKMTGIKTPLRWIVKAGGSPAPF